jgi:hypothetical protein
MFGDHPPAFGAQHPWHDQLAPQDLFDPRPDADLAMAGALAPDPQAFPFTPEGRRDYYAAVRAAAHQQQMMQMGHMQVLHEAGAREAAVARAEERRRTWFLLS